MRDHDEIRPPKCPPVPQDPIYVVGSKRRMIEDANEDCHSAPDANIDEVKDIKPSISKNVG